MNATNKNSCILTQMVLAYNIYNQFLSNNLDIVVEEICRIPSGVWWVLTTKLKPNPTKKLKLIGRVSNCVFKLINFFCLIQCRTIRYPNNLLLHCEYTHNNLCNVTTLNFTLSSLSIKPKSELQYQLLGTSCWGEMSGFFWSMMGF